MTGSDTLRSCFGFEVAGDLELEFLRFGRGHSLEVTTHVNGAPRADDRLVFDWPARPDRPFAARLFSDGRLYGLWISDGGWFVVDAQAPAIAVPAGGDPVRREERLWGVPAALCALQRGLLPLHAAAVEADGEALLLAAPRTFGKTTLAAGFARAGFRVLSEDVTCIQPGPWPAVIPGPAVLRLRPDVADRLPVPGSHRLEADDERIHLALDRAGRGDCAPVPVRAVLLLRPGGTEVRSDAARPHEAVRDLWSLSFRIPVEEIVRSSFAALADLTRSTPVRNLSYPIGVEQLGATVDRIVSDGLGAD